MDPLKLEVGSPVIVAEGASLRDGENDRGRVPLGEEWSGEVVEYLGDDLFRVDFGSASEGGANCYDVSRLQLRLDSPEARLAELVFGFRDTIETPNPERLCKAPEERDGRVADPVTSSLLNLILTPHTRAVLSIVDPQGLKQADNALAREGWLEGFEWPDKTLSTREQAIISIGRNMLQLSGQMAHWQGLLDNPRGFPEYGLLSPNVPDATLKEFARVRAEQVGNCRWALMLVGRALGFTDSEMFQAEEIAGDKEA